MVPWTTCPHKHRSAKVQTMHTSNGKSLNLLSTDVAAVGWEAKPRLKVWKLYTISMWGWWSAFYPPVRQTGWQLTSLPFPIDKPAFGGQRSSWCHSCRRWLDRAGGHSKEHQEVAMTTDIQNLLCLLHCQAVTLLTAVLEPEEGLLIAATRRTRVKILPMFVSLSVSLRFAQCSHALPWLLSPSPWLCPITIHISLTSDIIGALPTVMLPLNRQECTGLDKASISIILQIWNLFPVMSGFSGILSVIFNSALSTAPWAAVCNKPVTITLAILHDSSCEQSSEILGNHSGNLHDLKTRAS